MENVTFTLLSEISNEDKPIDAAAFWIRITGYVQGRKSFMRDKWGLGTDGVAMTYSTDFAFVEKEDGTKISAEPLIRFSNSRDPDLPGEAIKTKEIDLDSDEVQLTNKHGWSKYGSVYIKFNMPPPSPASRWKIHLGKVTLGTETIEIPEQQLCVTKGFSTTVWGNLP